MEAMRLVDFVVLTPQGTVITWQSSLSLQQYCAGCNPSSDPISIDTELTLPHLCIL